LFPSGKTKNKYNKNNQLSKSQDPTTTTTTMNDPRKEQVLASIH